MNNTIVEYFRSELDLIQDKAVKDFATLALANAHPMFLLMPASSTGKYHCRQSSGIGGLARHTRAVVYFATVFSRGFAIEGKELDKVIVAAICHDLWKSGNPPGKWTTKTHSTDCANWLVKLNKENPAEISKEDVYEIAGMVAWHMGRWEEKSAKQPFPECYTWPQMVIHLADLASASREVNLEFLEENLIG